MPRLSRDEEHGRRDLTGLVVRGIGWMLASQVSIQILGGVTSIVIARLLSPREVGLAAEALVFGSLALVIVDFGFASVLVQRPTLTEADKSTAFWTGLVLGVALTIAGIGLSWPIASLYGEPKVQPLFAVLSLAFVFTAPGIVQGALLTRELKFRSLELRSIAATAASATAAIAVAALGGGSWAIVVQDLVITSVSTALLWASSPWRPSAIFSRASLRKMADYTTHVFGTRLLQWGTANLDNFLVGRFVGAGPLGAYTIGFSMMITPVNRIATPIAHVFFPAFSRLRDPARIASVWLRAVRLVAVVVAPAMFGLMVVAPDFVDVVFGEKWRDAIPVMQLLAPVGLLQSLTALNYGILQAVDRARTLFRFTVVLSAASVLAFIAGLPWGIQGVATGYLVISAILQPVFVWICARALGISAWSWFRSVAGILQAGIVMLVIVLVARQLLVAAGFPAAPRLAVLVVIGAASYAALVAWRAPEVGAEIRELRARRKLRSDAPDPEAAEARST